MAKVVPILGIVCAVMAALFAGNIAVTPAIAIVTLLICAVVAVFAFLQRTKMDVLAGIVILLAGISALAALTPVTGDGKDIIPDMSEFGIKMLSIALLIPVLWILIGSRDTMRPTWLSYAGFGLVAVATVLVLVQPGKEFGSFGPVGILAGIACLLLVWPLVTLLRADATPAGTASASPPGATPAATAKTGRK